MITALADPTVATVLAATDPTALTGAVRTFVGPILLLIIGLVAIPFIINRQMTQIVMFVIIALVVIMLFYGPDILQGLAGSLSRGAGGKWGG